MADICIPEVIAGQGGVGGGGGAYGQASQAADSNKATSYGIPVIHVTTGMTAQFTLQLTSDLQGTIPIELEESKQIYFICLADGTHGKSLFQLPVQYIGNGKVKLQLTPKQLDYNPGLHFALIQCYDSQKKLRHVFKCCLQIQKSFDGSHISCNYPLTIAEVRMQLYDTSGQKNQLLNDLQFSDIIIARCIARAVDDWNQMPPTLANKQTPASFPYRANLCNGAVAHVFKMAAHRYIRNQMRHSNAGLSMDDSDKGALYSNFADKAMAQWRSWVIAKKNQLNMLQCMGSIADGYMQDTNYWW